MEYFPGGDLRELIAKGIAPNVAVAILLQVAGALTAVHAQGIVHRDMKPDNVMIRADGSLGLADFGIAKQLDSGFNRTKHGEVFGTPYYLAPEQALGLAVDQRTDIYSLGVVFFEMLTGRRPFQADNAQALMYQHVNAPIPRLPAGLEMYQGVIDKMMAKKAIDRFENANQLIEHIVATGLADPAWTKAGPPGRLLRIRRTWRRSLPWVVLLAAVAVTIVLTQVTRVDSQTDANQYFDQLVTRKARELGAAVAQVERDMRGAAGLVSAVGEPTAAQWAAYVASVAQQDTSASLIELGFAKAETGLDTTAVTVRQVGSIKARPFTRVDEALHKRPNIAAALRRAESDDALTLTPKIENMSGRTDVGPGALLFLPVRNKDVLLGYVYAAVRLDDLASEVARADAGYFRLRAYDGRATTPETLIFASAQTSSDPVFHKTTSLLAGGTAVDAGFRIHPGAGCLPGGPALVLDSGGRPFWFVHVVRLGVDADAYAPAGDRDRRAHDAGVVGPEEILRRSD